MKKRKIIWIAGSIILAVIVFLIMNTLLFSSSDKDYEITVVTKSKYGDSWELICKGAIAAANEHGVKLQILAPDYERDFHSQINLVQTAIDNKVDAIIIAPIDEEKLSDVMDKTLAHKITVVEMVSKADFNKTASYVGTDHYRSGQKIGAEIIDSIGITGTIAIISTIEETKDMTTREEGLRDYIEENSDIVVLNTEYCSSNEFSAAKRAEDIANKHSYIDAMVGLNEISSLGIAKKMDELDKDICIVGVDISNEIINYVDDKVIDKLIVQNYFSIGYAAVKNAVDTLQHKETNTDYYIETNMITPENIYHPDIQKIIFPLE